MKRVITSLVLAILFTSLLAGCGSPLNTISASAVGTEQYQSRDQLAFDEEMRASQSGKATRGEVINVLSLSGGGAWGAWGAGFLSGWRDNPNFPRPQRFDVVTGISTGGLQGTAAFIGEDEILRDGYTQVDGRDIMRTRFPPYLSALWSSSIYDTKPLGTLIQKLFTNEIIDRVAAASENGNRRLVVATCELDSGDLVFWDLSQVARSGQYDLYRSVVLATASIPGAFPPVNIGGKLHVDGGARTSLFLDQAILPLLKLSNADMRVYVIVNGQTVLKPIKPVNRTLPIAFRSVSMLMAAQSWNNLRQVDRFARDKKAMFWLSYVPSDYQSQGEHDFDQKEMNRLFDLGVTHGKDNIWSFVRDERPSMEKPPYYGTPNIEQEMKTAE